LNPEKRKSILYSKGRERERERERVREGGKIYILEVKSKAIPETCRGGMKF
jgi:hypothetical protein